MFNFGVIFLLAPVPIPCHNLSTARREAHWLLYVGRPFALDVSVAGRHNFSSGLSSSCRIAYLQGRVGGSWCLRGKILPRLYLGHRNSEFLIVRFAVLPHMKERGR